MSSGLTASYLLAKDPAAAAPLVALWLAGSDPAPDPLHLEEGWCPLWVSQVQPGPPQLSRDPFLRLLGAYAALLPMMRTTGAIDRAGSAPLQCSPSLAAELAARICCAGALQPLQADRPGVESLCGPLQARAAILRDLVAGLPRPPAPFSGPNAFPGLRLVRLPALFESLVLSAPSRQCCLCGQAGDALALCLHCGQVACTRRCSWGGIREHAERCCAGTVATLNLRTSGLEVVEERRLASAYSLYLDHHGEEDYGFRRGKALRLSEARMKRLFALLSLDCLDLDQGIASTFRVDMEMRV